ncbi:MAG: 50S ribosomal protein L31e [Candidatus Bathyarchaeia archaeon]
MSVEERIYTVPLGRAWIGERYKRAKKAMSILKKFVTRHMKPTDIVIEPEVNEALWARGIKNPPRKIRLKMSKDEDGVVTVGLAEGEMA